MSAWKWCDRCCGEYRGEDCTHGEMSDRDKRVNAAWVAFVRVMDPDGKHVFVGREWAALEAVVDTLFPVKRADKRTSADV